MTKNLNNKVGMKRSLNCQSNFVAAVRKAAKNEDSSFKVEEDRTHKLVVH